MMKLLAPLLLLSLTAGVVPACEKGVVPGGVVLPYAPSHYVTCFSKLSTIPIGSLTRDKVVLLVAELRKSELAKSQCGKDLLDWYARVRVAYGPKKS